VFVVNGEMAHGDVFNMSPGLVPLQFATVGDAGNADDLHLNGLSLGSVDYVYRLGRFEITAAQYTEFLNAVAADDTYSLYDPLMSDLSFKGCNIQRSGSPGSYTYSVPLDWANRPVNMVTFWDAARFVNWLHNGQPTGAQGPATTESGAYHHVGVQQLFGRNPEAKYFIPTEDEWYKAAYHKGGALTGTYWDYPTSSNDEPANNLPDTGNNANYAGGCCSGANIPAIGAPYYRSEVGAYTGSESPYGTFDQGGNVWEWNESVFQTQYRGLRGGSFAAYADSMQG
jgi:formylglycine-generating enzyme required for sulfatase activity